MWPFVDPFAGNLRKRARRQYVRRQPDEEDTEKTMDSIDFDYAGFYTVRRDYLGELCALILAQAQCDGATRVRLYYGNNKMIYTLEGTDYEMVPCPPPTNVDLVRAITKTSQLALGRPGRLPVRFADLQLTFTVSHEGGADDPYLEITGFTGETWVLSNGTRSGATVADPGPT